MNSEVPIRYLPGTAAANGFDADAFREELIDAMAQWNEESQSRMNMRFAGDTTNGAIQGSVVVRNQDVWACADNTSAKAFGFGGSVCESSSLEVAMIMRDSCAPNTPRQWRVGWPGGQFDSWGLGGRTSYEAVAVHELGHMIGLPDVRGALGVMGNPSTHATLRILHELDINSARAQFGEPWRLIATSSSSDGINFSPATSFACQRTTIPPGIGSQDTGPKQLRMTHGNSRTNDIDIWMGRLNWWSTHPEPPLANGNAWRWTSTASSPKGVSVVAWVSDCPLNGDCAIGTARTPDDGRTWSYDFIKTGTFGKPALAYDPHQDNFVIVFIRSTDARIFSSFTSNSSLSWSTPKASDLAPYRYMGGVVFDDQGRGLLVAASDAESSVNWIVQAQVNFSSSEYSIGSPNWLIPGVRVTTRRHFGLARSPSGTIVAAWRDTGGPRPLATAIKSSIDSSVPFSGTFFPFAGLSNGVDLAFDSDSNEFVAGFTYR
ncbi:MAG: hypothetical protein ACOZQL_18115 [Myxococcota bacterium]